MAQAARFGDLHLCPIIAPIPHVGGAILGPGEPTVIIEGLAAACVGDLAFCVGAPDTVVGGSATVMIGGRRAARVGDDTAHGGSIVAGSSTVTIG